MRFICKSFFIFLSVSFISIATAESISPVFSIVPSVTQTTVASNSQTSVEWTVANETTMNVSPVSMMVHTTGQPTVSIQNNTCPASLAPSAPCTFDTLIPGASQPSSLTVSITVCYRNLCSIPATPLQVTVAPATLPVYAFILTLGGRLTPVISTTLQKGTVLAGFSFSAYNGVAVSEDGTKVYVTDDGAQEFHIISAGAAPQILGSLSLPSSDLEFLALSPDGDTVYLVDYSNNSVHVINVQNPVNPVLSTSITVGNGPEGIAVSPDGTKVYVANYVDNTVSVIDTSNHTVVDTIAVGTGPFAVAVTPDGTKVYVANLGDSTPGNTISVINTATDTVTSTITVGTSPIGLAVSPNGDTLYVANSGSNSVSVIDTATNTVSNTINMGGSVFGVAINPNGQQVFVTSDGGTILYVIQLNEGDRVDQVNFTQPLDGILGNFVG